MLCGHNPWVPSPCCSSPRLRLTASPSVTKFPEEDSKLRAQTLEKRRGGNVANTLEVLQQLSNDSLDLCLLCVLPEESSPGTQLIKDSFGPKVDLSHCIYRHDRLEPASSYIIRALESESRTIVNYNDLPEMKLEEFREQINIGVQRSGDRRIWCHFEGREPQTSVACMRWLRQQYPDCILSAEIDKQNREGLDLMAAEADVVFFSKIWAQTGYESAEALLRAQALLLSHASLLFCTWGVDGASVIRPRDMLYHHEPACIHPDRDVVDTIGAGDTFIAGILHSLLLHHETDRTGERAKRALMFANQLAGRKVLQEGFTGLGPAATGTESTKGLCLG